MNDDNMKYDTGRYERWQMKKGKMTDDKMKDETWRMTRGEMNDGKRRHDIFPEDDILDIITISRYNYHK